MFRPAVVAKYLETPLGTWLLFCHFNRPMSSSLEAPPATAWLATHPMGRNAWTIHVLPLFAWAVMVFYFTAAAGLWGAVLLVGLAAANQDHSRLSPLWVALGKLPQVAPRLEPVKLS
jgi:hypothetical protein